MISEAILIPKIYARLQEIASNFTKFSGQGLPDPPPALAPSALGSRLRPLTGPPFPKFLDPPLICYVHNTTYAVQCGNISSHTAAVGLLLGQ